MICCNNKKSCILYASTQQFVQKTRTKQYMGRCRFSERVERREMSECEWNNGKVLPDGFLYIIYSSGHNISTTYRNNTQTIHIYQYLFL